MHDRPPRVAKNNAPNYNINQLSKESAKKEPEAEVPPKKQAKKKAAPKKPTPKPPKTPRANTGRPRQPVAGDDKKTRGRPRAEPAPEIESDSSSDNAAFSSPLTTAKPRKIEDELKENKKFRAAEKKRKAAKKGADKKKADAKKEEEKKKKGKGKGQTAGLTTVTPKTKILLADKPVRKGRIAKKTRAPKKKRTKMILKR
jgi:hypothetical protein